MTASNSMPANPEPAKEPLPAFRSWEECLAHAHAKGDPFFIDAFMFECWLGTVITENLAQYAELVLRPYPGRG